MNLVTITLGNTQAHTSATVVHTIRAPEKRSATSLSVSMTEKMTVSDEEWRTVALLTAEMDMVSE